MLLDVHGNLNAANSNEKAEIIGTAAHRHRGARSSTAGVNHACTVASGGIHGLGVDIHLQHLANLGHVDRAARDEHVAALDLVKITLRCRAGAGLRERECGGSGEHERDGGHECEYLA
ncbi:hypothetical protein OBBRIDRAFT_795670 [Obba rivulosa]|uniref:Uncharacterized protein n=1 Tax=Obba rivulosa TaxID=1052685 RepID=A0A8E2ANJ1_9APHY|nr:hypothetical protein OBBRIDRAFT_795670 [Obba rivulosa]